MKLLPRSVPGSRARVLVPEPWHVTAEPDGGLFAVEDVPGRFATSLVAVLDPGRTEQLEDPVGAATAPLVTPAVIDVRTGERGTDVLVCHLAGGISATALQRQVVVPEGLLVLTVTAATARWTEVADLAGELLDSLEPAS